MTAGGECDNAPRILGCAIVPARPRNPHSTLKSRRKEPRSPRPAKEHLPMSFIENMERAMHIEILLLAGTARLLA